MTEFVTISSKYELLMNLCYLPIYLGQVGIYLFYCGIWNFSRKEMKLFRISQLSVV